MSNRAARKRARQRGITLLEVMISMAVFAVGMLGLARMYIVASTSGVHARRVDVATRIGQELLHYLETVPFDAPALDAGGAKLDPTSDDLMDVAGAFEKETLDANLVEFVDDGETLPDIDDDVADPCAGLGRSCLFGGHANPKWVAPDSGRPTLDFNGDGNPDYERYWIVREGTDNAGGRVTGKHIAVVVRWQEPGSRLWRRVVHYGYRNNPQAYLP